MKKLIFFMITNLAIVSIQATTALYYNPETYPTTITSAPGYYYPSQGKQLVLDYYGIPQTNIVTQAEQYNYIQDAYYHRDYDQDDMYDKLYYDRPQGDVYSYYAGREADDDFLWNYS